MSRRRRGGKGGGNKRALFFKSVKEENIPTLRWSITQGTFYTRFARIRRKFGQKTLRKYRWFQSRQYGR